MHISLWRTIAGDVRKEVFVDVESILHVEFVEPSAVDRNACWRPTLAREPADAGELTVRRIVTTDGAFEVVAHRNNAIMKVIENIWDGAGNV